jgi:PAS domain-containing protein
MSGYSEAELLTMCIADLEVNETPEMLDMQIKKLILQGSDRFESTHRRKDGTVFLVDVSAQFRHEGEREIICFIRDITDRKKAETESHKQKMFLQKAQEIGKIGSWELNIRKTVLLWTDENYKIFGLPLGTALTYETFLSCVHPDDRVYVDREWKDAFDKKPYDITHRLVVDGKVKWVREKAELEFNENNKCIRGIGFTQDITEQRQIEEELKEAEKKFRDQYEKAPLSQ